MHPVLQHLIKTDFADLKGSYVEGQFAITDELVNLGLHELIAQLTAPQQARPSAASPTTPTAVKQELPNPKLLLQKVKVEHLKYRTEAGRTVLEVKAGM